MRKLNYLTRSLLLSLLLVPATHAGTLDQILERGTVRIGVSEFIPWTMKSTSGDLIGFEIDVAKKLADDMGVSVDIRSFAWEEIIDALNRGEIDLIAGGMAITPKRALRVDFTLPLAQSGVGLATNIELTAGMESLDELNDADVTIATVAETLSHEVSKTLFDKAGIAVYENDAEAEAAVLQGKAHAYLASMPQVIFLTLRNRSVVDTPLDEPLLASGEALAVRKGDQSLLNFLNAWVMARQVDKWIPSTREYWFRTLDWADRVAR